MTSSISCLNKLYCLPLLILLLSGCATVDPGPPPLRVESLEMAQRGLPVEKLSRLEWQALTSGAQGEVAFELWSSKAGVDLLEQSGSAPQGSWIANKPGNYRFKVIARDGAQRRADSDWSEPFSFAPAVGKGALYAVLPIENLSDSRAPMAEIYQLWRDSLAGKGIQMLAQADLEAFMGKYRMRNTGGFSRDLSRRFKAEMGAAAVLVTSLEAWQESTNPRVSLISRLVLTGDKPEIVWIDSIGVTGEDEPGLLEIGRIRDSRKLLQKAFAELLESLQDYFAGKAPEYRHATDSGQLRLLNAGTGSADESFKRLKKNHRPKFVYRATTFDPAQRYNVAVIPFLNINARKHAGKIVALHLVKQLNRYANISVFEPGLVRDTLLRYRMVMQSGPSLAASDVLSNENILGADLIVSGKVFDYQGDVGESKVDFSIQAFDGSKREVVWMSRSYATGNEGVYFYDWGKIPTAHGLVSRMTQAAIKQLEQ